MTNKQNNLPRLPKGWVWTDSGSLSWFVTSGSRNWKKYYSDSGALFIRTQEISTNRLSLDNKAFVRLPEKVEGKRSLVERNDLLFGITGHVGKVALVDRDIGEAYVSQSVALMKLVLPEMARFVHLTMITDGFGKTQLEKMVYGMGRPVLNLQNVQDVMMPLPPLDEQDRIVSRVEELLSVLDAGVESLRKVKAQSKRYHQAVLKYAFEGKLTEEWQKTHKDQIEPATKLLERIKQERKKDPKYKELVPLDASELPHLPENWVWAKVGEIGLIISGKTPKGISEVDGNGEIPFYKVADMNKVGNEKYMTTAELYLTADDIQRFRLHVQDRGTVVFPKRGGAIATNKKRILSSQSTYDLNIMGVLPLIMPHKFFYYWISSVNLVTLSDGSNVPQINHKDVRPLPFPLAPLNEQYAIVNEVDKRLSVVEKFEAIVEQSLKSAERLRQSILKRALEGKLVPQDPADEPAEKLLERIKEERARQMSKEGASKIKTRKETLKEVGLTRHVK